MQKLSKKGQGTFEFILVFMTIIFLLLLLTQYLIKFRQILYTQKMISDYYNFKITVSRIIEEKGDCSKSLKNIDFHSDSTELFSIKDKKGNDLIKKNEKWGAIIVKKMLLKNGGFFIYLMPFDETRDFEDGELELGPFPIFFKVKGLSIKEGQDFDICSFN